MGFDNQPSMFKDGNPMAMKTPIFDDIRSNSVQFLVVLSLAIPWVLFFCVVLPQSFDTLEPIFDMFGFVHSLRKPVLFIEKITFQSDIITATQGNLQTIGSMGGFAQVNCWRKCWIGKMMRWG